MKVPEGAMPSSNEVYVPKVEAALNPLFKDQVSDFGEQDGLIKQGKKFNKQTLLMVVAIVLVLGGTIFAVILNVRVEGNSANASQSGTSTPDTTTIRIESESVIDVTEVQLFGKDGVAYPLLSEGYQGGSDGRLLSTLRKSTWLGVFETDFLSVDRINVTGNGLNNANMFVAGILLSSLSGESGGQVTRVYHFKSEEALNRSMLTFSNSLLDVFILHLPYSSEVESVYNIDIPRGVRTGILGYTDSQNDLKPKLQGTISVRGVLSISGCLLNAEILNVKLETPDSILYVSNADMSMDSCPPLWKEYMNSCFYSEGPILMKIENAIESCTQFGAGLLKTVNSLDFLSNNGLLKYEDEVWIADQVFDGKKCDTLRWDGSIGTLKNCSSDTAKVVCTMPSKRIISTTAPYFSNVTVRNSNFLFPGGYSELNAVLSVRKDRDFIFSAEDSKIVYVEDSKIVQVIADKMIDNLNELVQVTMEYESLDLDPLPSLYVGVDSSNVESLVTNGAVTTFSVENDTVPSHIHIHLPDPKRSICVSSLKLSLGNNREVAFELDFFSLFRSCIGYNVCEHGSDNCLASLLQLDSEQKCAILGGEVNRDIVLDITEASCSLLSTKWRHPKLGQPILLELQVEGQRKNSSLKIKTIGRSFLYTSSDKVEVTNMPFLPTRLQLETLDGETEFLKAVRLTRYGFTMASFDYSSGNISQCIGVCLPFGLNSSLKFGGTNGLRSLNIDLSKSQGCQQIAEGGLMMKSTYSTESSSNVDACTSAPIMIDQYTDIKQLFDSFDNDLYKILHIVVNETLAEELSVYIPSNRGLIISGAEDSVDLRIPMYISVDESGFFVLDNMNIKGSLFLNNSGDAELLACSLLPEISSYINIQNSEKGTFQVHASSISGNESVVIANEGKMLISYTTLSGTNDRIENVNSLELARIKIFGSFFIHGDFDLQDKNRYYSRIDDNRFCSSETSDPSTRNVEGSFEKCRRECDQEILCAGFSIDVTSGLESISCTLCLENELAKCSGTSCTDSEFYRAQSRFLYTNLETCLELILPSEEQIVGSLEECKAFCSFKGECNGFSFDPERLACKLYPAPWIDSDQDCPSELDKLYLPYERKTTAYTIVENVTLLDIENSEQPPLSLKYLESRSPEQCAAICKVIRNCDAFSYNEDISSCMLYDQAALTFDLNTSENKQSNLPVEELYLDLKTTAFQMKEYREEKNCFVPSFNEMRNVANLKECMEICDASFSCVAFSFSNSFRETDDSQPLAVCFLYDVKVALNGLFTEDVNSENVGCQIDENVDLFVAYAAVDYLDNDGIFNLNIVQNVTNSSSDVTSLNGTINNTTETNVMKGYRSIERLTFDKCKRLCFLDMACEGFDYAFTSNTSSCELGIHTYVLERTAITNLQQYVSVKNITFNKISLSRNEDIIVTESIECKTLCDFHVSCIAFIFYASGMSIPANSCELLADITISDTGAHSASELNIGVLDKYRNSMIEIPAMCLLPTSDLLIETNCFLPGLLRYPAKQEDGYDSSKTSPEYCQVYCGEKGFQYYGVYGWDCWCDNKYDWFSTNLRCTNQTFTELKPCPVIGLDNQIQQCNLVGKTSIEDMDALSLQECKRRCFESRKCNAVVFNPENNTCKYRTSSKFDECDTDIVNSTQSIFIERFGHYYDQGPVAEYGNTLLQVIEGDSISLLGCQRLCGLHELCNSIESTQGLCFLRGGRKSRGPNVTAYSIDGEVLFNDEITMYMENLYAVREAYEYTIADGWCPLGEPLLNVSGFLQSDDCKALCYNHQRCGSFTYTHGKCVLFQKGVFSTLCSTVHQQEITYFVSYEVLETRNVHEFTELNNLCLFSVEENDNWAKLYDIDNKWECQNKCRIYSDCYAATFLSTGTQSTCTLYERSGKLALSSCETEVSSSFIKFIEASFTKTPCNLQNMTTNLKFYDRSKEECGALCNSWFNCLSYSIDLQTKTCALFENDVFNLESCDSYNSATETYTYFSTEPFTRLEDTRCISATEDDAILVVDQGLQIEACKALCNQGMRNCIAVEYFSSGKCMLFAEADFSLPCQVDKSRHLYISTSIYSNENPRFETLCFEGEIAISNLYTTKVSQCRNFCSNYPGCSGFKLSANICSIYKGETTPKSTNECESNAVYEAKTSLPYKYTPKTCLRYNIFDRSIQEANYSSFTYTNIKSAPFLNKELYECMALCDGLTRCEYFIYGSAKDGTLIEDYLQDRECKFFSSQAEPLDRCYDFDGENKNIPAYVNADAFVGDLNFLGVPEKETKILKGLSYDTCAKWCAVDENCNAFTHSWGFRRFKYNFDGVDLFDRRRLVTLYTWENRVYPRLVEHLSMSNLVLKSRTFSELDWDLQTMILRETSEGSFTLALPHIGQCLSNKREWPFSQMSPEPSALDLCSDAVYFDKIPSTSDGTFQLRTKDNRCLKGNWYLDVQNCSQGPFFQGLNLTQVSDPTRLLDSDLGECLDTDGINISYGNCSGASKGNQSVLWVYSFDVKMIHPKNLERCLTSHEGAIFESACNFSAPELSGQTWEYDRFTGVLIHGNKCLSRINKTNSLILSDCKGRRFTNPVKWKRYSECVFNTYEYSQARTLDLVASRNDLGTRKVENGLFRQIHKYGTDRDGNPRYYGANINDPEVKFKYFYNPNKARLQVGDTEKCIGRTDPENTARTLGEVDCFDQNGNLNIHAYWKQDDYWGGSRSVVNRLRDGVVFMCEYNNEPRYLHSSSLAQTSTESHTLRALPVRFRDDGVREPDQTSYRLKGIEPADVYVWPELALQEVTDPNLKYQIWLWSAEGVEARRLNSKLASFNQYVDNSMDSIKDLEKKMDELEAMVAVFEEGPIGKLSSSASAAVGAFQALSIAIRPLEYLPYVGKIFKYSPLPFAIKALSKLCKKLTSGMGKVSKLLINVSGKLISVSTHIYLLIDGLENVVRYANEMSQVFIVEKFNSFESGNGTQFMEEMDVQIRLLGDDISTIQAKLDTLDSDLVGVVDFKNRFDTDIVNPFEKINADISGILAIADEFKWLRDIIFYELCIPKPSISWNCKVRIFGTCVFALPEFSWSKPGWCVSLSDLNGVLNDIQDFLYSIPGLGELWQFIDNLVTDIVEGLFDFAGIDIPSIDVDLKVLDELDYKISSLNVGLIDLSNALNIQMKNGIFENVGGSEVMEKLEEVSAQFQNIDGPEEFQNLIPVDVNLDEIKNLSSSTLESINELIGSLNIPALNDTACADYEEVEIPNFLFPNGSPQKFKMCSEFLTSADTNRRLTEILASDPEFSASYSKSKSRGLASCDDPWGYSKSKFSVPLFPHLVDLVDLAFGAHLAARVRPVGHFLNDFFSSRGIRSARIRSDLQNGKLICYRGGSAEACLVGEMRVGGNIYNYSNGGSPNFEWTLSTHLGFIIKKKKTVPPQIAYSKYVDDVGRFTYTYWKVFQLARVLEYWKMYSDVLKNSYITRIAKPLLDWVYPTFDDIKDDVDYVDYLDAAIQEAVNDAAIQEAVNAENMRGLIHVFPHILSPTHKSNGNGDEIRGGYFDWIQNDTIIDEINEEAINFVLGSKNSELNKKMAKTILDPRNDRNGMTNNPYIVEAFLGLLHGIEDCVYTEYEERRDRAKNRRHQGDKKKMEKCFDKKFFKNFFKNWRNVLHIDKFAFHIVFFLKRTSLLAQKYNIYYVEELMETKEYEPTDFLADLFDPYSAFKRKYNRGTISASRLSTIWKEKNRPVLFASKRILNTYSFERRYVPWLFDETASIFREKLQMSIETNAKDILKKSTQMINQIPKANKGEGSGAWDHVIKIWDHVIKILSRAIEIFRNDLIVDWGPKCLIDDEKFWEDSSERKYQFSALGIFGSQQLKVGVKTNFGVTAPCVWGETHITAFKTNIGNAILVDLASIIASSIANLASSISSTTARWWNKGDSYQVPKFPYIRDLPDRTGRRKTPVGYKYYDEIGLKMTWDIRWNKERETRFFNESECALTK